MILPILIVTGDVRKNKQKKFEEKVFQGLNTKRKIIFLHLRDNNMTKDEMVLFFKNHKFSFVILKDCHDNFITKLSNIFQMVIKDTETSLVPIKGEDCHSCLEKIIKGVA